MKTEKDAKEDLQLIDEIKNSDKKAQEQLYKKYRTKLTVFLRRKFPRNSELEDDVSDILIKIFEKIYDYDSNKSKFYTWAMTIARNHMIDKSRLTKNNQNFITINNDEDSIMKFELTDTSVSHDLRYEYCDSLNNIYNNVTQKEYKFLSMKYRYGFSYNEIGDRYNMDAVTVSNKVNYIKTKLKKKGE